MKPLIPQTITAASILALALAVGGCSSSDKKADDMAGMMPTEPELTPQEMCEEAEGRWNADETCTTAEDLATEEMERVAAVTKAAGTKEMAIATEAGQTTDAGLGGSVEQGVTSTYSMTIEHDGDNAVVKIADTAMAGDDDPKFMQAMDLGGGRTMHVRTMEADDDGNVMEEVVVVSTDIEAPTATAFAMVETLDIRKDRETADEDNPNDSLTVAAGQDDVNLPKIKSTGFPAALGSTVTHTFEQSADDGDDVTPGDQPRDAAEVMGTYDGAMGTYTCDGNNLCTVTVNGEGEVTAVSTGWTFTPATDATIDVADADYLHYGFWLMRTTDKDGVLTYNEVETFAGSSIAAYGDVSVVTGRATYSGGATGVYVKNVSNPDGTIASRTSGHFSADASLTAHFGQTVDDDDTTDVNEAGQIAPNLLDTLSGTIDKFELSGGESNEWSVNLQGDITTNTGTVVSAAGATGGGDPGAWNASFHGPTTDDIQPNSVVGEFGANFSNGSVAGGFGARKDD